MNQLINIENKELTMSSRDIAELTGKRHDAVLRDIRNMLEEIKSPQKCGEYKDGKGRTQIELLLNKREVLLLVSGYSIGLRAKIIDRVEELENKTKIAIPQTLPEALRLAAELAEENNRITQKLEVTENALDRIAELDGGLTLTLTAKNLQIKRTDLIQEMRKQKWIYKTTLNSNWIAYQDKINKGWLTHKVSDYEDQNGELKISTQVIVTPDGLAKLGVLTCHL